MAAGGAAAAAAFAGIVGTGLAIAASQDRGYYGGPAYYGGGPYESYGYYGGPPAYYGGGGYYGGGYGYRIRRAALPRPSASPAGNIRLPNLIAGRFNAAGDFLMPGAP